LATTKPRIALGGGEGGGRGGAAAAADGATTSVSVTAWQMQPGEDQIVADRLREVLSRKRSPKSSSQLATPTANLSGRWDVEIEFFSSKSHHTLFLMQEGSQLRGAHKGDFSTRDLFGSIEGNQVKLRSQVAMPGDSLSFTFAGSIAGDTLSGAVYMGEYLNAKFAAKRSPYPAGSAQIRIPTGPPLAN